MAYPGVAIGVIIGSVVPSRIHSSITKWQVLLGKRKGPLGTGMYSVPGGKVDFGETPVQAAIREVKEETGLDITNARFTGKVTNDYFPDQGKHYINLFYTATTDNPDAAHVPDSEKEKFDAWEWFDPLSLPDGTWMHTSEVIKFIFSGRKSITIPDIDGE